MREKHPSRMMVSAKKSSSLFGQSITSFSSTPKMMVFRSSERELGLHFCNDMATVAIPKHIFTTILLVGSKPNVSEFATTAVSYELYLLPTQRGLTCKTLSPCGTNHAWTVSKYEKMNSKYLLAVRI